MRSNFTHWPFKGRGRNQTRATRGLFHKGSHPESPDGTWNPAAEAPGWTRCIRPQRAGWRRWGPPGVLETIPFCCAVRRPAGGDAIECQLRRCLGCLVISRLGCYWFQVKSHGTFPGSFASKAGELEMFQVGNERELGINFDLSVRR